MHPNLAQLTEYFLVEKTQRIANNTLHIKIIFNPPPHCASGVLNSRQLRMGRGWQLRGHR